MTCRKLQLTAWDSSVPVSHLRPHSWHTVVRPGAFEPSDSISPFGRVPCSPLQGNPPGTVRPPQDCPFPAKNFLSPHVNCKFSNFSLNVHLATRKLVRPLLGARLHIIPISAKSHRPHVNVLFSKFQNISYFTRAGPLFWLEKIYCYVPCKCAFYRLNSFPEFKCIFLLLIFRHSII